MSLIKGDPQVTGKFRARWSHGGRPAIAADAATARDLAAAAGKADPARPSAAIVFTSLGPPGDPAQTPSSVPGRPLREAWSSTLTYDGLAASHQGKSATISEVSALPDGQGPGYAVARTPLDAHRTNLADPCTPDTVVARTPGITDPVSRHAIVNAIVGSP